MKYLILIIIVVVSQNISIAAESIEAEIKNTVILNLQYTSEENIDKVLSTMHSKSPSYLPSRNALSSVFSKYDLKFELKSFKFIGTDGDLAYIRVKQTTKKISGPEFRNNELDIVQIYRQETGKWKLWTQANIDIRFIE